MAVQPSLTTDVQLASALEALEHSETQTRKLQDQLRGMSEKFASLEKRLSKLEDTKKEVCEYHPITAEYSSLFIIAINISTYSSYKYSIYIPALLKIGGMWIAAYSS